MSCTRQGLLRAEARRRRRPKRRTWCGRARRFWSAAARRAPTCSRASRWRCSAQLPWRGVPYIPVEIMLLPRWFSVPSRQGVVLVAHRDGAAVHPVHAQAARQESAQRATSASCSRRRRSWSGTTSATAAQGGWLGRVLLVVDRLGRAHRSADSRRRCARARPAQAEQWMLERLNGEDGLGAIFPAMVNALEVDGDPRLSGG